MKKLTHILAKNIKRIRADKDLRQSAVASKAGISPATLSRIEQGGLDNTTLETLEKLGHALDVNPLELLKSDQTRGITFYEALEVVAEGFSKLREGKIPANIADADDLYALIERTRDDGQK